MRDDMMLGVFDLPPGRGLGNEPLNGEREATDTLGSVILIVDSQIVSTSSQSPYCTVTQGTMHNGYVDSGKGGQLPISC